jgi:hypothetical protein
MKPEWKKYISKKVYMTDQILVILDRCQLSPWNKIFHCLVLLQLIFSVNAKKIADDW